MNEKLTFGSVCSGIEASQLAFSPFGFKQLWSSEIAEFPSKVLEHHFPDIPNVGDMINIPNSILNREYEAPDLFCGGDCEVSSAHCRGGRGPADGPHHRSAIPPSSK